MLLTGYRKEVVRPECRPEAESVHCIAHLDEDITEVIPYLNAVLGGFQYLKDPPSVSFKVHGKLIGVHPRMICVNALRSEEEGIKIIEWLKQEINDTWERRGQIEPRYESAPKPRVLEILKLLPKTNCKECGQPTCMVFATQAAEGGKGVEDCPPLVGDNRAKLETYLRQFQFE
ncbi:MAG: Fe-S cluster protein [Syntrophobacteraceae bacterium]|jgi:ArsR family metal-binding transcriptional regulator|nr:Fe-S cluster protein [Syntrophobacteraceae bacterium]